ALSRHHHVEHDEVRQVLARKLQGFVSVGCFEYLVAQRASVLRDEREQARIVVCYEDDRGSLIAHSIAFVCREECAIRNTKNVTGQGRPGREFDRFVRTLATIASRVTFFRTPLQWPGTTACACECPLARSHRSSS